MFTLAKVNILRQRAWQLLPHLRVKIVGCGKKMEARIVNIIGRRMHYLRSDMVQHRRNAPMLKKEKSGG
jgi:hypothetical protein